ncbi:MAG: LLM class flavin-dependent oxidoreductase [Actinomycetota bacterium]
MKFGLLYEIEVMRPWDERSHYNAFWQAIEQIKLAEELGFSHVWSVEHHFMDQFSISSAPEVWLAAAAQHTTTIRIGQGVVLLPFGYNHPIRVAERAATMDIVTNGRLEFGTGRSVTMLEMEPFGVDPARTREEWDEALRMIPKMWTTEEFSWESPLIKIPPRNVVPKPIQKPHPPMWAAGTQPSTAVVAGERGVGFLHFSLSDPQGLDEKVATYRNAIAKADPVGEFVNDNFAAFSIMFCGRDDRDAFTRGGPPVQWYAKTVETLYSLWADSSVEGYQWYRNRFEAQGDESAERSIEELTDVRAVCVGGPERCLDIAKWYESQGIDQLIFLVQAGWLRHDDICDSLRRFAAEVMPAFA